MNLQILERDDRNLVLLIEGISAEMINSLRRIIISEIPTMAIDEVIILKNNSPLYDEIIAHRLGLIPLTTDLEVYKLPDECECEGFGCPLCQVSLTCEITNTTNKPIDIVSGNLNSNDPKIIPVSPTIPIVKIDKNDSIIIEAYAILGIGKIHSKFAAVSNVSYRYYPEIKFDEKKIKDHAEKQLIVNMCPQKLFFLDGKTLKLSDDYRRNCTICKSCEENSQSGAIKVGWTRGTYLFFIESDGVMPFDVLLKKTFEIYNDKIDEFTEKLEDLELPE